MGGNLILHASALSAPPAGSEPTWMQGVADKSWVSPVSNRIENVKDPLMDTTNAGNTVGAPVRAFGGMVTDITRKILAVVGTGGHSDYHGNEVYSVDLSVSAPAWIRRRNATVFPGGGSGISKYADGRMASQHTGDLCIEVNGRWFIPGMGSQDIQGGPDQSQWWEFDPVGNDYIDLGTSGHSSFAAGTTSVTALPDPANNRFFVVHSSGGSVSLEIVNTSSPALAALTNTNNLGTNGGGCPGGYDSTNKVILIKDDADSTEYHWLNVQNSPSGTWTTLTSTGSVVPSTQNIAWHAPSGAFITWDRVGTRDILKGVPTVVAGGYTALNWSVVSSVSGTKPVVDGNVSGYHNKINVIPDMGAGRGLLVVLFRWGTTPDVACYILPAGGV